MNIEEKITKQKKSWLCKLGFHKFEEVTETVGYIDCGKSILKHEESWVECTRAGCNKASGFKRSKWVTFKKKEE